MTTEAAPTQPSPAEAEVAVLHQDSEIVVAHKPSGMPVHPSREHRDAGISLQEVLTTRLGVRVNPVHRIDRATSGLVMFSFSAEAAATYQAVLARPDTVKEYLALVRGLTPVEFEVDRPLTNRSKKKKKRKSASDAPRPVQEARSAFRRLATFPLGGAFGHGSLVLARIFTGRRHQIRRHLSHLTHQVLVDSTYGKGGVNQHARSELGLSRMCLHAFRLDCAHPATGERLRITAPLPPDLTGPLERLLSGDLGLAEVGEGFFELLFDAGLKLPGPLA